MLNWDKINAKLEKATKIIWGRKKEIDDDGNVITIDYVFTELWGFMTKELSPKALGILYARFEVLPNDDEVLSVQVKYRNKNEFETTGAQLTIDKYYISLFDKEYKCNLFDTNLSFTTPLDEIDFKIYKTNDLEKSEYVYFLAELFDLIKMDLDTSILKITDNFYIICDETYDKMIFVNSVPRRLPVYLKDEVQR